MEASKSLFPLILVCLLALNCNHDQKPLFKDNTFHLVLYSDPSTDCLDCNLTALKILKGSLPPGRNIEIILKPSETNERFKALLKENSQESRLEFYESELKVQHPSILLIKGRLIFMSLYITTQDPFLFDEYMRICRDLFLNWEVSR